MCVCVCVFVSLCIGSSGMLLWMWVPTTYVVHNKKTGKFLSNSAAVMFCKVTLYMSVSSESQAWNCQKVFSNNFLSQECPTGLVDEDSFKNIFSQFFPQGGKYLLLQYPVTCRNNFFHAECSKERHVALQMIWRSYPWGRCIVTGRSPTDVRLRLIPYTPPPPRSRLAVLFTRILVVI